MLSVDLHEFLGVVDLFFKKDEIRHLAYEISAHWDLTQFAWLVEFRVVHREIHHLFVIYDRDQLGSGQERFIMLDR